MIWYSRFYIFCMVKKILLGILMNGLALYGVTLLLSDVQYTGEISFFLLGGLIIGFLNAFIKPVMRLLSLPLIFLTVGLFSWVINIIIFWLTVQIINVIQIGGVSAHVGGALTYLLAAVVFAIVNWFLHLIIRNK